MELEHHSITFRPNGRGKARNSPNPNYPNGIQLDARSTKGAKSCGFGLPYPAPECGTWIIHCNECDQTVACTAAGRPDDPILMVVNCKVTHAMIRNN